MLNHSCRLFVARQTGLAQDLQGVIGLPKIRVVALDVYSAEIDA
jgi:hypothetical protein